MAQVAITFKGIKKKKLDIKGVQRELEKMMKDEGKIQQRELRKTRAGRLAAIDFEVLLDIDSDGITVITGPTGPDNLVKIWQYLNEGTARRWALMSSDWRSKTTPGEFRTRSGSGRVLIAGRRAMQARGIGPRPGIKARGWIDLLQKRRKGPFTQAAIEAMRRGADKLYD